MKASIYILAICLIILSACEERYTLVSRQPAEEQVVHFSLDSEIGKIIVRVFYPDTEDKYLSRTRFDLVLEFGSKQIKKVSHATYDTSPFSPDRFQLNEAKRQIDIHLKTNPSYRYASQHDDLDFSEEQLSNLPIGHILIDKTEWLLLPESSRCTGFLVSDDLAVTNNHCLSDQAVCDRLEIKLWNSEDNWFRRNIIPNSFACEELLFTDKSRDQSLFRIAGDAAQYKKFKIQSTALNMDQDEIFRISSMDQSDWTARVYRAHRKCVLESDTNIRRQQDGKEYIYAECNSEVLGGNSGSPVFNSNGDVFGVLWGANKAYPTIAAFTPLHPTIIRTIKEKNRANKREDSE